MTPRAKAKPEKVPEPGVLSWTTTTRKILDLIPHPTNPRQMTTKQVEDLTASIAKFNLAEIPAINANNTILAGHQRLKIMALLGRGDEEIDVRIPSRQLTEEEEREYLVRSNKNAGEWDFDILANSFDHEDLIEWGFEPKTLGIGSEEEMFISEFVNLNTSYDKAHILISCDPDAVHDILRLVESLEGIEVSTSAN